ncbi:MAG: hypothetical protein V3S51_07925 [Dehalococcoidia bacterium]
MVSTVVTLTTAAASVTAAAVVGLIIFLVVRELADASERRPLQLLSRYLGIYATPLLIAFAFIAIMEVVEVIG